MNQEGMLSEAPAASATEAAIAGLSASGSAVGAPGWHRLPDKHSGGCSAGDS